MDRGWAPAMKDDQGLGMDPSDLLEGGQIRVLGQKDRVEDEGHGIGVADPLEERCVRESF